MSVSLDFGGWLSGGASLLVQQVPLLAQIHQAIIQDKPTNIVLFRQEVALASQTLRVELDNSITMDAGAGGVAASRQATLFGIQDHPTLPDTDIQEWDTFILDDQEYTVTSVNRQLHGQVQAYCEGV